MEETITTDVTTKNKEEQLSFTYEDDVISLRLNDKEICRMDYNYNFALIMERMLEIWGKSKE